MTSVGERIREARDAAKMSDELLAKLASVDLEAVRAAEAGGNTLSADDLDRLSRVFGVRWEHLLAGEACSSPLSLLFRSSHDDLQADAKLELAIATELHHGLGEFLRVVRDVAELESKLGIEPHRPWRIRRVAPARPHEPRGEQLARSVRAFLEIGNAPIPSMRKVVEDLGVVIVWTSPDELSTTIDGASTLGPRPAMLVNLVGPPWRTRMTLAHELCHLLFDYKPNGRRALASPSVDKLHERTGLQCWPSLEEIEVDARAFAASLLAPSEGIRDEIGSLDPASEAAIRRVGTRFGVGRTVATNRLRDVFRLREAMPVTGPSYESDLAGDAVSSSEIGLRAGVLPGLIRDAVREGRLSGSKARRLLGLSVADELPFDDLDPKLRAASVSREEVARRRAARLLAERWPEQPLDATGAVLVDGRWRVDVARGGIGASEWKPLGYIVMSTAGELEEEHLQTHG
jgi:transcriptional regulator with XRE-family HTH domain